MFRSLIAVLMALIFATTAHAQWRDKDGKPQPDTPWQKSVGTFGAMMMMSPEPEKFVAAWEQPARSGYAPQMVTTEVAKRGDVVVGFILFSGCAENAQKNCNVDADLKVVKPDGSIYAAYDKIEIWQDKPAPSTGLQLAAGYLGVEFEPADPFGTYTFHANIRDNISGTKMELVQKIALVEKKPAKK